MHYRHKKRPYLLLEIMIAFSLVFFFVFSFLRTPWSLYHYEKKKLDGLIHEKVAIISFTEILPLLYQNKIPLQSLLIQKKTQAPILSLTPYFLSATSSVERQYCFVRRNFKEGKNSHDYLRLEIILTLTTGKRQDTFSHFVFLEIPKIDNSLKI